MFVPVLHCFFVFLILPQLRHGYIGTIRSAGPRQSLSLLVACRDPRLPPWPAVVPLATRDPHTATVTSTAQSHPRCPSWVAEDPVSLLSHLQAGLVLLGMPSLGTGSYPVQATDVPAISCPRWTGGQLDTVPEHRAHSKRRQRVKKVLFSHRLAAASCEAGENIGRARARCWMSATQQVSSCLLHKSRVVTARLLSPTDSL